jgi:anti-sigma factor RsiW
VDAVSEDCAAVRISLGVYVLGALEPAERAVTQAHVAGCPACREELALISGLPGLLGRLSLADVTDAPAADAPDADAPDADADASDADATDASDGARGRPRSASGGRRDPDPFGPRPRDTAERTLAELRRRRRRVRRRLLVAAAALAAAAAGASAAVTAAALSPAEGPPGRMLAAVDADTRVQATVWIADDPTGTAFTVRLRGVPPGTHCVLVALGPGGRRETAASWVADYHGHVDVRGASGIAADRLTTVLIVSDDGEKLVALPVRPA